MKKNSFFFLVLTNLITAKGFALPIGPSWKRENGTNVTVQFYEAQTYCKSINSRLPTVDDFASYAESLGAKGRSEIAADLSYVKLSTDRVFTRRTPYQAGIFVDFGPEELVFSSELHFFYSPEGYQQPQYESYYRFWTTTRSDFPYVYVFNQKTGKFESKDTISEMAVKCLKVVN